MTKEDIERMAREIAVENDTVFCGTPKQHEDMQMKMIAAISAALTKAFNAGLDVAITRYSEAADIEMEEKRADREMFGNDYDPNSCAAGWQDGVIGTVTDINNELRALKLPE